LNAHAEGYAQACAEAVAKVAAEIKFGQGEACDCDISQTAYTSAIAHEVEMIFAFAKLVRTMLFGFTCLLVAARKLGKTESVACRLLPTACVALLGPCPPSDLIETFRFVIRTVQWL
jgi:hypothetical protein